MPKITYNNQSYDAPSGRSVLDVLLDNGVDIPFACGMGECLTCMMKCSDGSVPKDSQFGLTEDDINNGYFLVCCCFPKEDISVESTD